MRHERYIRRFFGINRANLSTGGTEETDHGFRGLYTTGSGDIVNSDLNGSANIGRKAMCDLFCNIDLCSFMNYKIISYPDYETMQKNRKKQMVATHQMSKSKMRRLRKKQPAKQM